MSAKKYKQGFVLGVFSTACFLMTSCDSEKSKAAWWQSESERVELEQAVALKGYRLDQSGGNQADSLQSLKVAVQKTDEKLELLRRLRAELQTEVAAIEREWPQVRDELLQGHRGRLLGKTLPSIKSTSGREYKDAIVAQIDDTGVLIRHDAGSVRLRAGDLDAEQHVFFGLDTGLAMVAEKKEQQQSADYHQWIDKQLVAVKDAEQRKSNATNRELEDGERMRARILSQQDVQASSRPLAQSSAPVTSRFSRFYSFSSRFQRNTPSYHYYYTGSNGYSGNSGFSESTTYVGGARPNTPFNPQASVLRPVNLGSSCPPPRISDSPQYRPESPVFSVP